MEKILITGSAGFIGFHLVNNLLSKGFEVIGLDNINSYYDTELKYNRLKKAGISGDLAYNTITASDQSCLRFIKLDLTDKNNLINLFKNEKFDYVINLAAQAGVRNSIDNPDIYIESNVYGFLNILEACRRYPVKHLIYASSSSVYGANKKVPFSENDVTDKQVSLYGATKKSNELFAHAYSHLFNVPCTGLRFFTVYGPWGRPDMAYYLFTKNIYEGKPIKVFNNGLLIRDFTYIDDITNAFVKLIKNIPETDISNESYNTYAKETIFNIGANNPVKLIDFIKEIEIATGKKAILEFLPMQQGDVYITYANVDKLQKVIGNSVKVPISRGIPAFVDWYKWYYNISLKNSS